MKPKILIFIAVCILGLSNACIQKVEALNNLNLQDSVRVYCSPDLFELTSNWVAEYSIINKGVKTEILKITNDQTDITPKLDGRLCFVSNDYNLKQNNKSIWKMIVGVDAVVPIINSKNPFLEDLKKKGVTSKEIAQLFKNRNNNWGVFLDNKLNNSVNFYTNNSELVKSDLANYLKIDPNMVKGINVGEGKDVISAIQKDIYGIGFCKISSILNANKKGIVAGVNLLPIDKNGNGKIDNSENIYSNLNTFLRGVWIGKYPKELCDNIYSISNVKPTNESAIAFLTWLSADDGQQYLNMNGFSDLTYNQRQANINQFNGKATVVKTSSSYNVIPVTIGVLAILVMLFFTSDYIIQYFRQKKSLMAITNSETAPFIDARSISVLDGLYFDKSHTWAFMERQGVVSIGIDDFLQHVTGPITRVKMKNSGDEIKKGEPFLTIIQEGKQLIINAPITGTIKAQNKNLLTNPSIINSQPYSEGWIYMIEPAHWLRDTQFLIIAQGYREWIKMEFLHLKDFLAVALRPNYSDATQIVLQDGGEIKDGVLKDLKPEIWEDFQTHFLDCPK